MIPSLVLSTLGWLAGWWLWGHPERLGAVPKRRTGPDIAERARPDERSTRLTTVIVPARNEAHTIAGLLEDLRAQQPPIDVVVVDDHSTDDTATIARRVADQDPERIRVESAAPLPPGWVGKNWACHQGASVALAGSGSDDDLLVFVDADVRLAPDALGRVAAEVRPGRVLSVQPFHTTRRAYEQLSLFCGVVALGAIGAGRRRRPPHGMCGPLLAMTVSDHRRLGGHAAVRSELVEDLAIGRRLGGLGVRTRVLLGGPVVRYRMYPAGARQLVEGWTKNLATGAGSVPLWRTALCVLWVTALGDAAVDMLTGLLGGATTASAMSAAVYGAFVLQVAVLGSRTGTFGLATAALYPVPLAAFVALTVRSAWRRSVRRSVAWRGRTVPTGRAGVPT